MQHEKRNYAMCNRVDCRRSTVMTVPKWVQNGTISTKACETVVQAKFQELPTVFQELFTRANQGKLITELMQ